MSYYYLTNNGKLIDSTSPIANEEYYHYLTTLEYQIARLVAQGFSRKEIKLALNNVFDILTMDVEVEK